MTFAQAAAVPLGGFNALHFMRRARVAPGERVLNNGAGGAIGAYAAQIAKSMGATVTAVDHGRRADFLVGLGADQEVDYTRTAVTDLDRRFEVVLDMIPSSSYRGLIGMLEPGGRYLYGNTGLVRMAQAIATSRFSDKSATFAFARETLEELEALREMIEAGRIVSTVDRVLPRAEATEAHRLVETEERIGAIVIAIDNDGSG